MADSRALVSSEKRTKGRGEMDSVEGRFGLPVLCMLGSWSHITQEGIDARLVRLSAVMAGWHSRGMRARAIKANKRGYKALRDVLTQVLASSKDKLGDLEWRISDIAPRVGCHGHIRDPIVVNILVNIEAVLSFTASSLCRHSEYRLHPHSTGPEAGHLPAASVPPRQRTT